MAYLPVRCAWTVSVCASCSRTRLPARTPGALSRGRIISLLGTPCCDRQATRVAAVPFKGAKRIGRTVDGNSATLSSSVRCSAFRRYHRDNRMALNVARQLVGARHD